MSDLHRRRSSCLCLISVFISVVCVHTTFAATSNPAPATDVATSSSTAALSPEIQGDLLMVHRSYAAAIEAYQRETQRSAVLANKIGVAYHHLFALDHGSCSTTGVLSYSWRLILAPSHVLNYLAAHEVAHLIEMNHSAKFWRLVRRLCPEHERAKVWLEVHGSDLHRYGMPIGSPGPR